MAVTRPQVRSDLDVADVDGERVVYDARRQELHFLNYSAALVFGFCDGTVTAKEIAAGIADAYEMPTDEVDEQVDRLLREFRKKQLLASRGRGGNATGGERRDERELIRMEVPHNY